MKFCQINQNMECCNGPWTGPEAIGLTRPPVCGCGKGSEWGGGGEEPLNKLGCGGGVRGEALSLPAWSPGGEGDDPSLLSRGLLDLLSRMSPVTGCCLLCFNLDLMKS